MIRSIQWVPLPPPRSRQSCEMSASVPASPCLAVSNVRPSQQIVSSSVTWKKSRLLQFESRVGLTSSVAPRLSSNVATLTLWRVGPRWRSATRQPVSFAALSRELRVSVPEISEAAWAYPTPTAPSTAAITRVLVRVRWNGIEVHATTPSDQCHHRRARLGPCRERFLGPLGIAKRERRVRIAQRHEATLARFGRARRFDDDAAAHLRRARDQHLRVAELISQRHVDDRLSNADVAGRNRAQRVAARLQSADPKASVVGADRAAALPPPTSAASSKSNISTWALGASAFVRLLV
jgi:hypothetical protein